MPGVLDFLFGKGALKKAAGDSANTPQPAQPAGIDIAGDAQKVADKINAAKAAKGNDTGIGGRAAAPTVHPNDAGMKSRAKKQSTQPNDVGLKGGSDYDD